MKTKGIIALAILFAVVSLTACTGHHNADDFDLIRIQQAASALLQSSPDDSDLDLSELPEIIKGLNPESVFVHTEGIYIQLDSFFVEESGLFLPRAGIQRNFDHRSDPSYKLLGHGVYSYHVTG
jgi:hypothetical protein